MKIKKVLITVLLSILYLLVIFVTIYFIKIYSDKINSYNKVKLKYDNLFKEHIDIYGQTKNNNLQMLMYYQDAVLNELKTLKQIPASLVDAGGLKIYTALDLNMQAKMEENILKYQNDENIQVASVIIEPETGAVKALTGGMDYAEL